MLSVLDLYRGAVAAGLPVIGVIGCPSGAYTDVIASSGAGKDFITDCTNAASCAGSSAASVVGAIVFSVADGAVIPVTIIVGRQTVRIGVVLGSLGCTAGTDLPVLGTVALPSAVKYVGVGYGHCAVTVIAITGAVGINTSAA